MLNPFERKIRYANSLPKVGRLRCSRRECQPCGERCSMKFPQADEPKHLFALPTTGRASNGKTSKLNSEDRRGSAPPFTADQIDSMNRAFKQACAKMGLTGSTPVIELVAVRILELAYAGEFDPDKLRNTVVAEFGA
jgi:hypothetical protein